MVTELRRNKRRFSSVLTNFITYAYVSRKTLPIVIVLTVLSMGCFPGRNVPTAKKRQTKIEGQAGRMITGMSVTVDADYDPRLDNLIAGFKLLPVVLKNMSLRNIPMDDKLDRWVIVGEKGQKYKAVNSLRHHDARLWREVPEKMQNLIDYPEVVPINYSVTFDLLIPAKANLEYFKEIHYFNAAWGQELILEKDY